MGYKVKLTVFHRTWEVDYFSIHYYRYIDYRTNKPTSKVNGGYIEIIIRSSERDDIFPWWQFLESADENYLLAEGRLDFYKDSFEGPIAFSYEFQDAFIVEQGERFSGWDNGPMRLHLIISPAIQRYKGVLLVKPWHKSPLPTNEPTPYQPKEPEEFYISIKRLTDTETFVPLGIPAFDGTPENKTIAFEFEVTENGIDDFQIDFLHDNNVLQTYHSSRQALKEVVVTAKGSGGQGNSTSTTSNYPVGKYTVTWDGFDSNGIYDSTIFTTGKLKAKIKGRRNGEEKTAESSEFSFEREAVDWVDVKIDKNSKRIDVTLRVNLTDGGAKGLEKGHKIPKKDLIPGKPPLKTRSKSFKDLEKLVLEGLNYHWGRNGDHFVGKNVDIDGEKYEVFINAINTIENAMDDIKLIFNTNRKWVRSMNPGSVDGLVSFFGQVMPERIVYNYGYIKWSKDWHWLGNNVSDINNDFSYIGAHEIGHEILKSYSGAAFHSYKHKGSSTLSETLPVSKGGANYPTGKKEIDLMKYYNNDPFWYNFERIVASNEDVLGLIWLNKIKIK